MPTLKEIVELAAKELDARQEGFADRKGARAEAVAAIRHLESLVLEWFGKGKVLNNLPMLGTGRVKIQGVRLRGSFGRKIPCFPAVLDDPRVLIHTGAGDEVADSTDIERLDPWLPSDWTVAVDQRSDTLMLQKLEAVGPGDVRPRTLGMVSRTVLNQLEDDLAPSWQGLILGKKGTLHWLEITATGPAHRRKYESSLRLAEDSDLHVPTLKEYLRALDFAWEQEEHHAEATNRQLALAKRVHEMVDGLRRDWHDSSDENDTGRKS